MAYYLFAMLVSSCEQTMYLFVYVAQLANKV